MQAQRFITEVTNHSISVKLPEGFKHHRVEVIVLGLDEQDGAPLARQPHPEIAGRVKILGDIVSSVPEQDWDLPR